MTGAAILSIVYGMDVESDEGASYFRVVERGIQIASGIGNAGVYLGALVSILYYNILTGWDSGRSSYP